MSFDSDDDVDLEHPGKNTAKEVAKLKARIAELEVWVGLINILRPEMYRTRSLC